MTRELFELLDRRILCGAALLMITITGCSPGSDVRDYDRICAVITAEMKSSPDISESLVQRADRVSARVHEAIAKGPALDAFTAVQMAAPESRYQMFKQEAERVTGQTWDCPAWLELQTTLIG